MGTLAPPRKVVNWIYAYKDFSCSEDLEKFQLDNDIVVISIENIIPIHVLYTVRLNYKYVK
jgi:hypothetical protein